MKNIILALMVIAVLTATAVAATPQFGAEAPLVSANGNDITITGTFIDAPAGANVQLFCGGDMVAETPIVDGAYTIKTVYGGINGCNAGAALLESGAEKAVITIPAQFIITSAGGGHKDNPTNPVVDPIVGPIDSNDSNSSVPEFPLFTMGLAIVGVGLGLAFLRKE